MVKRAKAAVQGYDPGELTVERVYVQEEHKDDPRRWLVVTMRSDLTTDEATELLEQPKGTDGKPPTLEERNAFTRERMAPYVVAWNVLSKGQPVPPPAEAGGEAFRKINSRFEAEIWQDLALRSTGVITDSKRLTAHSSSASPSTDGTPSDGDSDTTS